MRLLFCRRSLRANHQQKVEEAIEQAKTLRKAMKAGDMATQVGVLNIVVYFALSCQIFFSQSRVFQNRRKSSLTFFLNYFSLQFITNKINSIVSL